MPVKCRPMGCERRASWRVPRQNGPQFTCLQAVALCTRAQATVYQRQQTAVAGVGKQLQQRFERKDVRGSGIRSFRTPKRRWPSDEDTPLGAGAGAGGTQMQRSKSPKPALVRAPEFHCGGADAPRVPLRSCTCTISSRTAGTTCF